MPEERRVAAWIGASLVIEGNLSSSEDTTVAGQVKGDVAVKEHALIVSQGGRIRGNIVARFVMVHGEVVGTVTATHRVEVSATGSIQGDINAPRMAVEDGAVLHGRLTLGGTTQVP